MSTPVRLVSKPTADEEIRRSVIEALQGALIDAEAGQITGLVLAVREIDGDWHHRASVCLSVREEIGALECIKYERIIRSFGLE